jgi:hypothetical protein
VVGIWFGTRRSVLIRLPAFGTLVPTAREPFSVFSLSNAENLMADVRDNIGTIERAEISLIFRVSDTRQKHLVFSPLCFASRGSPVRSRSRLPTFSLIAKVFRNLSLPQSLDFVSNCARTVHECCYCIAAVHIGVAIKTSAAAGVISLARRFSFSKASRFICNFIWEYFLKTCASPWRSIWVTHSSATPPALSLVAYVERR